MKTISMESAVCGRRLNNTYWQLQLKLIYKADNQTMTIICNKTYVLKAMII